ncbi:NrfD/PsrC family molybdoenzyme membrane anchor subunit [Sulfurospirillum sp. hDNRA2]|uniref:NrfD/PsrC family molybdoenzyme membrane anchor subunit n=1 Tax=Sulfurospirillum sp. hDNRA2 TaxID=3237298 RepID=UPI0020B67F31|nr:NrfD/PsrC family molybdoenzyme membrane anchor subunit [Sulfurospirillum sp. DNRA8]MCP3652522.1 polysulfide reductase NrfD [Sulfurospirillum sp. DNRA8]MCR1811373.1 polysulfide reductase NrfD [Sulfurospirillum sp. DNRA8]
MNAISLKNLFSFEKTPLNLLMAFVTVALVAAFFSGAVIYILHGHHAYNVTRQHPWGLLISMYVFFVVSSTGLCIISSIGHVFGIKEFQQIGKRAIAGAIITISSGFAVIGLEIGHPVTMLIYNVLTPGLTSAIWWMGTLYGLYLTFICLEFFFLAIKENHTFSKIFGICGLLVGLAAHSNLGAVFGFLISRPSANGVFYPVYFILSAMITGCYLIFLMYGFKYKMNFPEKVRVMLVKLSKILGMLLAVLIFFEVWKILTALYGDMPERAATIMHAIKHPNFWFGELTLGMLIPFVVILVSNAQAIKATVYASITGMVGIFFMRYGLVHDTLLYPMTTLKRAEYQLAPSFVDYFPSATEFMIGFGGIGLSLIMYYFADKIFNLDESEETHH